MSVTQLHPDEPPERPQPNNLQAERSLLGAILLSRHAVEEASENVSAGDFYLPAHGDVFAAVVALLNAGEPTDPTSVHEHLRRTGSSVMLADLLEFQRETPVTTSAGRYARIIAEHAALRRTIAACRTAMEAAYALADVDQVVGGLRVDLDAVDMPLGSEPAGVWLSGDLAQQASEPQPWVIPGLLRRQWRALFVSGEGSGKSVLLAQLAHMAACGTHPLSLRSMPACRSTLMVDLENSDDVVVGRVSETSPGDCWVWHRPEGIDLRTRRDRSAFEALIAKRRPELVCMGPLYKAYTRTSKESDEQVAVEVQQVLDRLRIRYGFALVLEHHAGHGESGARREMRPYGSSLWLRWPEFGIGLKRDPDRKGSLKLGRFRGDRVKAEWPERIDQDGNGGWIGRWNEGF